MSKSIDENRRSISSCFTFFYKYIFTAIWIGGFGFGTLTLFKSHSEEFLVFLIVWIVGSLFLYWFCARLKYVRIDSNNIYISNYLKTVKVPLNEIEKLSENVFINIHPIWISFNKPTAFGRKIMFMPKFSFRASFFCSHPIVNELLLIVKRKSED